MQSPTSAETLRKVGMHKKQRNANYVLINSKFSTRRTKKPPDILLQHLALFR
jgi:hypothetical protein